MNIQKRRAIIAAIVAGLFSAESYAIAVSPTPILVPTVKCMGAHNCKSMGACKAGANNCGGKNACKAVNSKSIVTNLTAQECEDKGGTVVQ